MKRIRIQRPRARRERPWLDSSPGGGEAAGAGLEILVLDEDGRIRTDYQFIER